ncbi:hypothetical protein KAR91_01965 [Candidatus Pacearchaeota archaeon]|nr:hypothetical protein [Candidatus Pacearchaeota archaeon]
MKNWKEERSFGEVVGLNCRAGALKVSVHRYIGHPKDQWFVSCSPFFNVKPLESKDLGEARCQAAAMVQVKLEEAITAITA